MEHAKKQLIEPMNYKWEFLRRNKKYQSHYGTYEYILKDSDDNQIEWFGDEVCREFGINYLVDYRDNNCPNDMFESHKDLFHKQGPYSIRDMKEEGMFNVGYEFETTVPGKFAHLNDDEKKLVTFTFNTSKEISDVEFQNLCDEIKKCFNFINSKKSPKGYNHKKHLDILLMVFDEHENNGTLMSIYKVLKDKELYQWKDGDKDQIKPQILQLIKRANRLVEEAINLNIFI